MAQTHSLDLEASSSQYASITVASQTGLKDAGSKSVMAWIKLESSTGAIQTVYDSINLGSADNGMGMFIDTSLKLNGRLRLGGSDYTATSASALTTGVWYHVAITYNDTSKVITVYINGKSDGTTTGSGSEGGGTSNNIAVGTRSAASGLFLDGLIKDVRYFNATLSQAQIVDAAHTENYTTVTPAAEWNFNNAYTDSSGNGNTLTATNSPVFSTTIPWTAPADGANAQFIGNAVSWWTFDEESGTRADSIASNDLSDTNTVGFGTGKWDNAADFEKDNSEYLSISHASQTGLDLSNLTIAGWLNMETSSTFGVLAIKGQNDNDLNYRLSVNYPSAGNPAFSYSVSGTQREVNSSTVLSTGTWYHIAVVYSTSFGTLLYVNGVLDTINTSSGTPDTNTDAFVSGARRIATTPDGFLDGLLDELSIYNTALDYGNILDLYAAGAGIPYAAAAAAAATPTPTLLTLGVG